MRSLLIAGIAVTATACATFDAPVADNDTVEGNTENSERLPIPETPAAESRLRIPGQDTATAPIESNRLPIPQNADTTQNSSANSAVRLAPPTDQPAPPVAPPPPAPEPPTPQAVTASPIKTEGPKPHHRNDDINVITWRAERGHIPSQLLLGRAYARGNLINKDMEQARLWLELAALQGNLNAQYELGLMYFIGAGVAQDYINARNWWMEAADSGNPEAQQRLGYMYSEALGVARDYDKAKDWYLKAATQGNAEAQTLLGSLYHEGNRITPDYAEAFKWYRLGAEQGHPYAQYAMAILHHDGLGAEQDYIKCAAWVDVALANQHSDELGVRDLCRSTLDEQSHAAADALATMWKAQYSTN